MYWLDSQAAWFVTALAKGWPHELKNNAVHVDSWVIATTVLTLISNAGTTPRPTDLRIGASRHGSSR